jgi:crotonobetaine/carnitine-CoA ligase
MVPILLAQPEGPAERAHRVRIGLGPGVPAAACDTFRSRTGVMLLEGYGSTETNFVIATAANSPRSGVMGWLRPGFQARVVDEHDVELPPGEAGELALRADEPFAFATGYFGMPDKTLEAWRNLWFHTGDRVVREADGAFRFVDRIKDAIRRRGENVSSYEVEQVLLSHPDVGAVAVYPVHSELAEDEVMAALIPQPGRSLDPAELARFCAARLPRFAVPRYIDVVSDLPRTENGKVQKYKLRERGVTAATWDGEPQRTSPPL